MRKSIYYRAARRTSMWKYTTFTLSGTETLNWVSCGNEKRFAHMSTVTLDPQCPLYFSSIVTGSQSGDLYDVLCPLSEKAMAPHSSTLAWKIPWMEELGRLQSMGSLRIGHDWATSLSLFTFLHWRRKWQPTPVFLPGESQGRGSLVGCHLWGRTESDTTEVT